MVVGEGPSRKDEQLKAPFEGHAGKLLDTLLRAEGIARQEVHLTNAALCRGEKDKDNEKAAECCAPRLLRELTDLKADGEAFPPIVPTGKSALRSTLGYANPLFARGFVWRLPEVTDEEAAKAHRAADREEKKSLKKAAASRLKAEILAARAKLFAAASDAVILPTVSLPFVLKSEPWTGILRVDFERVGRAVRGELPRELSDVAAWANPKTPEELYELGDVVSLDVETDGVDALNCKLLCVGLSDGTKTKVIWPWSERWAEPLNVFLRSRSAVIGHNVMAFDRTVLEMHGVR